MAGPHSPDHTVGTDGPMPQPPPLDFPNEPTVDAGPPPNYPGQPVPYPARRSKRRFIIGALLALALVAALTLAIAYGVRTNGANTGSALSEGAAKTAIQQYLDALDRRDIDVIVRNALCGMYDGVRDKRSDQALAKMSSDAFRKQFSEVELTSIDKIVYLSQYQAQALFTMRVTPATGGPPRDDVQGVAQLLFQRGQIEVCSYVLRTGSSY
jgi:hypothetical protein